MELQDRVFQCSAGETGSIKICIRFNTPNPTDSGIYRITIRLYLKKSLCVMEGLRSATSLKLFVEKSCRGIIITMFLEFFLTDELFNQAESIRRKYYKAIYYPRERHFVVNELTSPFNRYWKDLIEPRMPSGIWKDSLALLKDIIGDEFKRELGV